MTRVISDDALAALTIRGEADSEDMQTKMAVAEVIRNRMSARYTSDGTVAGTVLAPGQFSCWWWRDPGLIRMLTSNVDAHFEDAAFAWHAVHGDPPSRLTNGALRYVNLDIAKPAWATPDNFLARVGKLSFFKG